MTDKEYMDQGEQYLVHTYNRFKIVLDKGEGVYLYDVNGKKYLVRDHSNQASFSFLHFAFSSK